MRALPFELGRTESGGFCQGFGHSVRLETNSFDGYCGSRQAFFMMGLVYDFDQHKLSWSTDCCADDEFVTSVALSRARGHTTRDNSPVAVDAELNCAWSETQKRIVARSHDQQIVFLPLSTRWWTTGSFFWWKNCRYNAFNSYSSSHPICRPLSLHIGQLLQRNHYSLYRLPLNHVIRCMYSPSHHNDMENGFNWSNRFQLP